MLPMSHQRTRRYLRLQRADISQNRGESGGILTRCDTISGVAFDASEDADAQGAHQRPLDAAERTWRAERRFVCIAEARRPTWLRRITGKVRTGNEERRCIVDSGPP
jgi:hypothetical protein